jgi:hypothetical protein
MGHEVTMGGYNGGSKSLPVPMLKCVHHCLSTETKRHKDWESILGVELILHPLLTRVP